MMEISDKLMAGTMAMYGLGSGMAYHMTTLMNSEPPLILNALFLAGPTITGLGFGLGKYLTTHDTQLNSKAYSIGGASLGGFTTLTGYYMTAGLHSLLF